MNDRTFMKKLLEERPLTAEESLRLDDALENQSGRLSQAILRDLPEDQPSLAWRSDLNTKLARASQAQKKRQVILRWLPAMAAPVAAGCAFLLLTTTAPQQSTVSPQSVARNTESIEEQMVDLHRDAVAPVAIGVQAPYDPSYSVELASYRSR